MWLEGIKEETRHLSTMGCQTLAGFLWYVILQKVHCQHGNAHQHQQASFTAEEINQVSFDHVTINLSTLESMNTKLNTELMIWAEWQMSIILKEG